MKVICDGLELCDAAITVNKAIGNKTTNPILEGIKLVAEDDTLTLSATDLELSIEKKIRAEVKEEGETIVPGKFFTEFIKKLTGESIELSLNEKNQLKIKYTDSESMLQCYPVLEYPGFKKIESGEYFGLEKKDFKELINKTLFAVAVDDSRPILKGVLFEVEDKQILATALDGYRLAHMKKELKVSTVRTTVIVPSRSLSEISKLLDDSEDIINIYIQKNYIMADFGDCKVITRLLEGDFINYNQIISSTFETVVNINKNQFEDALERASLLSKIGQNNLVKFDMKDDTLCLTSNSEIGNIKENVNISMHGKELLIAFNARYFIEALRVLTDEFVTINFNSPSSPCIIKPLQGDEYLYLILPVRMINW